MAVDQISVFRQLNVTFVRGLVQCIGQQVWVEGQSYALSRPRPIHFIHGAPRQKKDRART